jgi:hypothetical protein
MDSNEKTPDSVGVSKWMTVVLSLLLVFSVTGCVTSRQANIRRIKSFTSHLPACDKVEVYYLDSELERDSVVGFPVKPYRTCARIIESKDITGREAQSLADSWRAQKFGAEYQALCHEPVYGLRFYQSSQLIYETTLCFSCRNFYVPVNEGVHWWGFDSRSAQGKELLNRLQQIFPGSIPKPETKRAAD